MLALPGEFAPTIEAARAALAEPIDVLPESRRLDLLGVFERMYPPDISVDRQLHTLTVPEGVELGKIALLPITPKRRTFLYDASGITDRFDPPISDNTLAALQAHRRRHYLTTSHLDADFSGAAVTTRLVLAGTERLGESLIIVRANDNLDERTSTSIHEATHVVLNETDPNLEARATDPKARVYLNATDEIECLSMSVVCADRLGLSDGTVADRMARIDAWEAFRSQNIPSSPIDTARYVFA